MNRVFGKKKATSSAPAPTLDEASTDVGKRVDHMDVKIAALDKELKGYKDKLKTTRHPGAKKNLQKRAMDVIKRKRMYEQQRDQLTGQQFNIDQAAMGIQSAKASVSTVAAMKTANKDLKNVIRKDLDIDEVDDLADDMAEMMDEFNEINEALGRNFATPDDIDETDLEAELDMLDDELLEDEAEEIGNSTPSYLQTTNLPAHPTTAPGGKVANQTDEYGLPIAQHH